MRTNEQPHIDAGIQSRIHDRVLLHHSWNFLVAEVAPLLDGTELHPSDDYPVASGTFNGLGVTLVATGMGVDESMNVVDQLAQAGVGLFVKLGTYVALREDIRLGDIAVPDAAARVPGSVDAILPSGETPLASPEMVACVKTLAAERQLRVRTGTILTCPVYGPYIRDEVVNPVFSIDYWRNRCFGDEMECAAVFATASFSEARSAAILVCNRTWAVLDAYRRGDRRRWRAHRTSRTYAKMYQSATRLAMDALTTC